MTVRDWVGISDTHERYVAGGLQLVLAGLFVSGLVIRNGGMAFTSGIALAVTLFPAWLEREFGFTLDPGLLLWLALAVSIHTVGSMGLYEQYEWFDNIAHTVSAMVIAGIGYASFRALELHSRDIDVPSNFRAVFILVFVLATGVFWEILEFALGDLITVYGIDDIVTDMVFNTVGAILVAVWGTGYLDGLTGFFRRRLRGS